MAIAPGEGITQAQAIAATIAGQKQSMANAAAAALARENANIADSDARLRAFATTSPNYVPPVVTKEEPVIVKEPPVIVPDNPSKNTGYSTGQNGELMFNGSPFNGTYNGKTYVNGWDQSKYNPDGTERKNTTTNTNLSTAPTGPTLAKDVFKQTLAIYFGQAETSKPWMDELYNLSAPLYKSGATMEEALNMALLQGRNNPNLADFTKRFAGIFALQDKKLAGAAVNVPTIAEYYNAEAGMGSVLRQAGLADIATTDYLGTVIGKGLSVTDVGNYINNIYTEIQNLPSDIKAQVTQHYPGLDNVSLAKSILTGDKGFAQLQQDLNTYEIQGVGTQQGVSLTDMQARDLVGQGYNMGSATTGLSQVALDSPAYQRLQEISTGGKVTTAQAQGDLIDANMKKLASQRRKVEQAISAEQARFQTTSGNIKNAPPHTFSESGAY